MPRSPPHEPNLKMPEIVNLEVSGLRRPGRSQNPTQQANESNDSTVRKMCSRPRRAVRSHSLECSKNYLLIVGIGPILNKDIELIFLSDLSDRTCVYS